VSIRDIVRTMKNFKEGGFGGGGGFGGRQKFSRGGDRVGNGHGKFGGNKSGGKFGGYGGDRGDRSFTKGELFSATCSSCGKPCEVPFKPSPDKPVFCSACFSKNLKEKGGGRGDDGRGEREFKREARPRNQERSFTPEHKERKDRGYEELKNQILILEAKLNKVIELLTPTPVAEKAVAAVAKDTASDAPKKVRKPKTVQTKAVLKKKAVKKAAKVAKAVKKAKKTSE
jgi:CxxC-x17-CxxC domain-containing protein